MKRFFSAVALCVFLLITGLFVFLPYTKAQTNPLISLLNLPAPPPPNPLLKPKKPYDGESVNDKSNPPKDDVPIEELLTYWNNQSNSYQNLRYSPKPSEKAVERIMEEIEKKPEIASGYLNILPDTPEVTDKIKRLYDSGLSAGKKEGDEDSSPDEAVKAWLTNHSKYYVDDLLKSAKQVHDANEYVTNQDDLLALVHVDWETARPIVERLYGDSSQPVSQTLARWALYKHAIETNDSIDTEKYRDELKKTVENTSAGGGMRDLAMDSLVNEGDWQGRDEWYYSLLNDETLYDIKVNGQTYTGLTTLILKSPPEKYKDKMVELVRSSSPVVRGAAIRNLSQMIGAQNPDVVEALLPWLENPKWAQDIDGSRRRLIEALGTLQIPASVPGLLAVLNEKRPASPNTSNANRAAVDPVTTESAIEPMERGPVITALGTQKDPRAIGPIRQVLPELQEYERSYAVRALFLCGGFSIGEQVDALETAAKEAETQAQETKPSEAPAVNNAVRPVKDEDEDNDSETTNTSVEIPPPVSTAAANAAVDEIVVRIAPLTPDEIKKILGQTLVNDTEPEEPLVAATIDRISVLDRKDPPTANALRIILRNWKGIAVNAFLLKDLKNGKADSEGIVKLLSLRKSLREKQPNDVYGIRSGTPAALGISACLIENDGEYNAILESGNSEAKTAMLACARLIRARLPVQKVAENLKDSDKLLAGAAEKYLESEDSAEARAIVLSLHPNEAKILGATVSFSDENSSDVGGEFLGDLYASLGDEQAPAPFYYGYDTSDELKKAEKQLKKELKGDQNLLGVYAFDKNYVRIFNDKVVFSWEEDESRYHERTLQVNEFEYLKNYLASQNVSELPPFIESCEQCEDKELLMLGRQGGRRVFLKTDEKPEFFAGLEKILTEMREPPAQLHYKLEKEMAGLEILYADDNLKAKTVWKNGADLRVLIDNEKQREQIDNELKNQERIEEEAENFDAEKADPMRIKRREQREYENYSWQQVSKNQLVGTVPQPSQAEYIPLRDGLAVASQTGQWKLRAGAVEIRNDTEAIYKITRGQLAKIHDGYYTNPVLTPDARWLIATKYDDQANLMRINLLTNKETMVKKLDGFPVLEPVAFVPSLNKILIFSGYGNEGEGEVTASTEREGVYYLLDAATGLMTLAKGEVRPLIQQSFRPLQPAAGPDEFWAAIPNTGKNQTVVGIYNAKTLTLKPLLKIPKISFDSMDMWADAAEKKIYFVYQGQLLSLPMPK